MDYFVGHPVERLPPDSVVTVESQLIADCS